MKQSHKLKAMLAYETTPERKAEVYAEECAQLSADADYLPPVPLDPELHALLQRQLDARIVAASATIASCVADEKSDEADAAFRAAFIAKQLNGDKTAAFTVVGQPHNAQVFVVKEERRKAKEMQIMRAKLPDDMPEVLKDMLVKKLMSGDVGLGANGVIELDADEPPKEKTPMRFH